MLPTIYLDNIARYVENGGAVLESSGPEFSGVDTLFQTPLGRVLPGQPTGVVMTGALRARLTDKGARATPSPPTCQVPASAKSCPDGASGTVRSRFSAETELP